LGTVAESRIRFTWSGNIIMTSSHTTPLYIISIPRTQPGEVRKGGDLEIVDIVDFIEYDEFDVSNEICTTIKHAS